MSVEKHRVFARRYRLERVIGRGAQGEVWAGWDELEQRTVAVKLIWSETADLPTAAEATALRLLRVPGVVHYRESGEHEGHRYLAMDLVEGASFPGRPHRPWPEVLRLLFRLLVTLDNVHAHGVVHGDLKPEHVVVGPDDQVVLLDFGLATGLKLGARDDAAGTLGYAPLELMRGEPASPRVDLFAAGVMAYEALTGALPWAVEGPQPVGLTAAMLAGPPPLAALRPDLPPAAARLILDLLAASPADRPVSAAEAADQAQRALAGHTPRPPPLPEVRPLTRAALATLFHGPERILHLPTDAAAALLERAGTDPDAISAELERWELLDVARRDGDRLRISSRRDLVSLLWRSRRRSSGVHTSAVPPKLNPAILNRLGWICLAGPHATIKNLALLDGLAPTQTPRWLAEVERAGLVRVDEDRRVHDQTGGEALRSWDLVRLGAAHRKLGAVLEPGTQGRLDHLLAGDALAEAAREAVKLAAPLVEQGHLEDALGLLEQAVVWARANGDEALEATVLHALTPVALATEATRPARLAARLLERALDQQKTAPLRQIIVAALAALEGDPEAGQALRGPWRTRRWSCAGSR